MPMASAVRYALEPLRCSFPERLELALEVGRHVQGNDRVNGYLRMDPTRKSPLARRCAQDEALRVLDRMSRMDGMDDRTVVA